MSAAPCFLDANATTRPDPRVVEAMRPLLEQQWGNPGSGHRSGREAFARLDDARRRVAARLGVEPLSVVFTSSATESDNLAIAGLVRAIGPGAHVVTTAVEHPAVLDCCRALEEAGLCRLDVVGVDSEGRLDLRALERAVVPGRTSLVSVMAVNNETGVVMPVEEVGRIARAAGARLHVDAVQAVGKLEVDHARWGADFLALSAHKFHGPRGVGVLTVPRGMRLEPLLRGGHQERGLRPGTENVAGAVGLTVALELAIDEAPLAIARMRALRDRLETGLTSALEGVHVSGAGADRAPNTSHLTIEGIEAEALLLTLDREGLSASAGSACSTGALGASPVLVAMGVPRERIHGALRLSLSRDTTPAEVDRALELVPEAVRRLRALR